jgi:hypothetical protein
MMWLAWALAGFVAFVFVCHIPLLPLVRLAMIDVPNKGAVARCFGVAWLRNLLALPADLLAPLVVPVALLFTRTRADHLPRLFWWWDNDASINGDKRIEGQWELLPISTDLANPAEIALCYWAPGHHPRSFYARWVWLGLRNRASALSQALGTEVDGPAAQWSGSTWTLHRVGDVFRFFELLPVGPVVIRMHCGFKVPRIPGEPKAPAVSIGFSVRRAN